jgi:exonuclease III
MTKTISILLVLSMLAGCGSMQVRPLSCDDHCALQSMKCDGVNMGSETIGAYNYNTGYTTAEANYSGVRCSVPKDREEAEWIEAKKKSAMEQDEQNVQAKQNGMGIGVLIGAAVFVLILVLGSGGSSK